MSEIGEVFAAMKAENKIKKQKNAKCSKNLLLENDLDYEEKNGGTHLIVKANGHVADFWPSTGKYRIRPSQNYRRGVFRLMKELRKL